MDTRCNTVRLHHASITVLILGVAGACFCEDKHDARMRESMPIRYAHSANMHRHIGLVRSMSDLNLSDLAPVMATSKHAEDFTRQVGQWWRKDSPCIVWQLTVRPGWTKQACQFDRLMIHVQDLQHMRKHHNSRSS